MLTVNSEAAWRRSVWLMRVLCPLDVVAAVSLGSYAWYIGATYSVAISFFCAGVGSVLGWVNWRFFQL